MCGITGDAMLKRLAAVFWWLGAVLVGAMLALYLNAMLNHAGCSEALARNAEWERQQALSSAEYLKQHPGATGLDVLLDQRATTGIPPPPETDERLRECRHGVDWFGLVLAVIVCVSLWSVAFVLGGRFWLPPARST